MAEKEKEQKVPEIFPALDEAATFVAERLGVVDDRVIVEGKITEMYVSWNLKRGDYNSEEVRGHLKWEPTDLPCDFIVDKVGAEIMESRSSAPVTLQVFRRLGAEMDAKALGLMAQHMLRIHTEKTTKAKRVEMGSAPVQQDKIY